MRPEILNRLILAKALYKQGRNLCSAKNDRFKFAMGLISFHDAIDQVLGAIAEEVNLLGVGRNRYLIQLFNKLENYDSQKPLLYGQQVRNLNTLRNNIKHQGIFPNPKTEAYLSIAIGNFLEDTCRKYFNIDFNSLSLAELIRDSKIKQEVLEAERLLEEEDYKSALEKMAIAMFFTFERSIVSEAISVRTMMVA